MRRSKNEAVMIKYADGTTGSMRYEDVCHVARRRLQSNPSTPSATIAEDLGLSTTTVGAIRANLNR